MNQYCFEPLVPTSFAKFMSQVREHEFLNESNESASFSMPHLSVTLPKIDEIEQLFMENELRILKK